MHLLWQVSVRLLEVPSKCPQRRFCVRHPPLYLSPTIPNTALRCAENPTIFTGCADKQMERNVTAFLSDIQGSQSCFFVFQTPQRAMPGPSGSPPISLPFFPSSPSSFSPPPPCLLPSSLSPFLLLRFPEHLPVGAPACPWPTCCHSFRLDGRWSQPPAPSPLNSPGIDEGPH